MISMAYHRFIDVRLGAREDVEISASKDNFSIRKAPAFAGTKGRQYVNQKVLRFLGSSSKTEISENFHVRCNIVKDNTSETNTAHIVIQNINPEFVRKYEESTKTSIENLYCLDKPYRDGIKQVIVYLGYIYGVQGKVFHGDVRSIRLRRLYDSYHMEIIAEEGMEAMRRGLINKCYASGTTARTVLNDAFGVLSTFGIDTTPVMNYLNYKLENGERISDLNLDDHFEVSGNPYSVSDTVWGFLTRYLKSYGFNIYISNNVLIISPTAVPRLDKTSADSITQNSPFISVNSGLFNYPIVEDNNIVEFESLINPYTDLGHFCAVQLNENVESVRNILVSNVTFNADNYEGDFKMSVKGYLGDQKV